MKKILLLSLCFVVNHSFAQLNPSDLTFEYIKNLIGFIMQGKRLCRVPIASGKCGFRTKMEKFRDGVSRQNGTWGF